MSSEQNGKDPTHVAYFTSLTFGNPMTHKIKYDVQGIMRTSDEALASSRGDQGPGFVLEKCKR